MHHSAKTDNRNFEIVLTTVLSDIDAVSSHLFIPPERSSTILIKYQRLRVDSLQLLNFNRRRSIDMTNKGMQGAVAAYYADVNFSLFYNYNSSRM